MKKIVLFISCMAGIAIASAQTFEFGSMLAASAAQQMVRQSVEQAFVHISRQYRLQDTSTMKLYGSQNRDFFGKTISIGIKVKNGLLLPAPAIRPWDYDTNFARFSGLMKPVAYRMTLSAADTTQTLDSIAAQSGDTHQQVYSTNESLFATADGLDLDTTAGEKKGWLVWMVAENDSTMNFVIYQKSLSLSKDSTPHVEAPKNVNQTPLGGIYIVPDYTSLGRVSFLLCGLIVAHDGAQWGIVSTKASAQCQRKEDSTQRQNIKPANEPPALTPIEEETLPPTNGRNIRGRIR